MRAASAPRRWWLAACGPLLLWIYATGIASNPPKWEEPRRCLVAQEMIHSGDYVVPRLLGEPYLNKPPLQSWLIVLFSGIEARQVGPLTVRLVSLCALAGIAWLLWRMGIRGDGDRPHALPPLVFLTFGTIVQFGRSGELDILFCFFSTAALASFEIGRRRGSPWLQWFAPSIALAGGILTKGYAPLFFYPPALFVAWRHRRAIRFAPGAFTLGALAMVAIVCAWFVPYVAEVPLTALAARWGEEVESIAPGDGRGLLALQILRYPLVLLGAALPWSVFALALASRRTRLAAAAMRDDLFIRLCVASAVWGALVFAPFPGMRGRYLIPALPALAVLVARLAVERAAIDAPERGVERVPRSFAVLLVLGLLYGVAFAGVFEPRTAARNRPHGLAAQEIARSIGPGASVVCAPQVSRKFSFALSRAIDRPLRLRPPAAGSYLWIGPRGSEPPQPASALATSWQYTLWSVDAP